MIMSEPHIEICYEFSLPRESHDASRIAGVLIAASGQRYALTEVTLDRRGESIVCQIGRPIPVRSPPPGAPAAGGIVLEAIELSADVPLGVRGLRGQGGET